MAANAANGMRELNADEIDGVAGAANPWIVRIAAKLIIAAIDYIAENGLDGRSTPRAEKEIGNKV